MKKVLISILAIFFIVCIVTTVYAATGSIDVSASSSTVIKGKTFTITVAGTGDSNITGMQAGLSYDANKLEIQSKTPGNNFGDLSGANEIAIATTSNTNLAQTATLYTITFKVLDNAEEGETTISINNAVLALVGGNTEGQNKSVTITIKSDNTTVDNGNGEQTPSETPADNSGEQSQTPSNTDSGKSASGSNSSSNSSNASTKSTNTTKKTSKLPQTGVEEVSVIAIIALGSIAIASFIAYKKYKEI